MNETFALGFLVGFVACMSISGWYIILKEILTKTKLKWIKNDDKILHSVFIRR